MSKLKLAIPTSWKNVLKSGVSIKTRVNTFLKPTIILANGKEVNLHSTENKQIYNTLIRFKITKPYVHTYWDTLFQQKHNWENIYKSIHNLKDNRIKQFRYKLIHKIIPSKEVRFSWNISSNKTCNICDITETYSHLFIFCKELKNFWDKITEIFKKCEKYRNWIQSKRPKLFSN